MKDRPRKWISTLETFLFLPQSHPQEKNPAGGCEGE
jgi:hypothetical protein